ncbi:hypothetical protein FQ775_23775 [Nitratireductor mangrovi]|uniref:GNAT family N-acetyltransferase n=1 Tax=Nitratireductor mangrovi TaxID=2599600 RepID=A0A6H0DZR9_9HYPH|nr:hypothetical protein [Nitratireductor mangrovi]QIS94627.1 hypothetical protein FQ775_23775 [Nitratireductor mangrovi]
MPSSIRQAEPRDIDALVAIENAVFSTDRISRRSFRQLIESDSAKRSTLIPQFSRRPD